MLRSRGKPNNKANESKVKVWFSPSLLLFYLFLLRAVHLLELIYQISSLSSKSDRSFVQDTRESWELMAFLPLLLRGWAILLVTLNLCFLSVVQKERVFFSQCCAVTLLCVIGEQCLDEQCLIHRWGDVVLYHELGVPRKFWMSKSLVVIKEW